MPRDNDTSLDEIKRMLAERAEEYGRHLASVAGWGGPTRHNDREIRWGENERNKSSGRSLVISRGKRGLYCNHYGCTGGTLLDATMDALGRDLAAAIRYAKKWLGLADDWKPEPISEEVLRERERKQAEDEARESARRSGKVKFAGRLASEIVPLSGNPGATYLASTRGIPSPDAGWPDCMGFHPGSTSLLLIATTLSGELQAIQRVFLTDDGQKIPAEELAPRRLQAVKQTDGPSTGAAIRLPGDPSGPLLLAEGPETALSAWVSTGLETWATLGRLPRTEELPTGRLIIWLQDDDREHSPRDKELRKKRDEWRRAGLDARLITPWPKRGSDKRDFNDLLRESGPEAVRARIESAIGPRPPEPPKRHDIAEAQDILRHGIQRFIDEARNFDADLAAADGIEPAVHAIGIDTGGGKTHEALAQLIGLAATTLRPAGRTAFVGIPTHLLASEQAERMLPGATARGLGIDVWRGANAADPDRPGEKMCRDQEMMIATRTARENPDKTACVVCEHGPKPGKAPTCGRQLQQQKRADIWVGANNLVFDEKPAALGKPGVVILDENPLPAALEGVESLIKLSLDTLRRVNKIPLDPVSTDRLMYLRHRACDLLDGTLDGPLLRETFEWKDFTEEMAREAHGLEWRTKIEPNIRPGISRDQFMAAMAEASPNADLGRRSMFWKTLAHLLSKNGTTASGRASLVTEHNAKGASRHIELRGLREVRKGWRVPTLILDATLQPEPLKAIWPNLEVTAEVRIKTPHLHVTQVSDRAFSLSMLDVDGAKDDKERAHRERNVRRVHAIIVREARRYYPAKVLVVAQLRVKNALEALGMMPGSVGFGHHNGIRGIDRWRDVRCAIVVGRTLAPANAIAKAADALTGIYSEVRDYIKQQVFREMADGSAVLAETWRSADPIIEALRWSACEAELTQIIGRVRGVHRTADSPVSVLVLTDTPLPLPVHELIQDADLDPGPDDRMLAAGAIAFENARHAAAAYPQLWPSWAAARFAMHAERRRSVRSPYRESLIRESNTLLGLLRVTYQMAAQGSKAARAWFDPALIPDVRSFLEGKLGPLASCRISGPEPPPPTPPDPPPPQPPAGPVPPLVLPGPPIELTARLLCPVQEPGESPEPEAADAEFDASEDPFAPDERDFDADAEGADWLWFSDPPGACREDWPSQTGPPH